MAEQSPRVPTGSSLRKLLEKILVADSDLDAFCVDHFPKVEQRFTRGMERQEKVTLLLKHARRADILARLTESEPEAVERHIAVLQWEQPGPQLFAGAYRSIRVIGRGGMGTVYEVEQESTGRRRALKRMKTQLAHDEESRSRFIREAKVGAMFRSEHVVDVIDAGVEDDVPWLVMELLEGTDLFTFTQRTSNIERAHIAEILKQLCRGLAAAHDAGVVHRDLKPQNIFLSNCDPSDGRPFLLKILDFGIAKVMAESVVNSTSSIGTPSWMAPEQTLPKQLITPAADVWSIGLLAFWLFTRHHYFRAADETKPVMEQIFREMALGPYVPASQRAQEYGCRSLLPRGFDGWFEKCVIPESDKRLQNAKAAYIAFMQMVFLTDPQVSQIVQISDPPRSDEITQPTQKIAIRSNSLQKPRSRTVQALSSFLSRIKKSLSSLFGTIVTLLRKLFSRDPEISNKRRFFNLAFRLFLISLLLFFLSIAGVAGLFLYYTSDPSLPTLEKVDDYHPKVVTRVLANDGQLIGEIFEERRTVVPRERIPRIVIDAFVDAEDAQFFEHGGISYTGMVRALVQRVTGSERPSSASTLTQQLVSTYLLKSSERSLKRKIQETYLALRLEKRLSKEEILWLYLNQIYFGHGRYGIEEAARYYFGKSATDVNAAEAAILASLPKAPEEISPRKNPERAKLRQRYVLSQMERYQHLSKDEAIKYAEAPIRLVPEPPPSNSLAPEFVDLVERELVKRHGQDKLPYLGLNIRTSCDLALQRASREALEAGLRRLDERNSYRGPLRHLADRELAAYLEKLKQESPGGPTPGKIVEGVVQKVLPALGENEKDRGGSVLVDLGATTGSLPLSPPGQADRYSTVTKPLGELLKPGDVIRVRVMRIPPEGPILAIENGPQGAAVVIDPESRHILAMVGGYGFQRGDFNRALRAKRQPGSAFKTIVFATAFESKSFTPASVLNDSPQVYNQPDLRAWAPKNAGDHNMSFMGPVRLRTALAQSLNTVASQLIYDLKPDAVIRMARALGIESPLESNYSLALGSSEVTPLELTNAYATLAARGRRGEPIWLLQVGEEQPARSDLTEAVSEDLAFVMSSVLQSVIDEGTGAVAKGKLKRPAAGKTGTSNSNKDAWFIGYTPNLTAGVWVGFDEPRMLGEREQGARAALPIWLDIMQAGLRDRKTELFVQPAGVVVQRIDPRTGKLPARGKAAMEEVFLLGTEPKELTSAPGQADPDKAIWDNN